MQNVKQGNLLQAYFLFWGEERERPRVILWKCSVWLHHPIRIAWGFQRRVLEHMLRTSCLLLVQTPIDEKIKFTVVFWLQDIKMRESPHRVRTEPELLAPGRLYWSPPPPAGRNQSCSSEPRRSLFPPSSPPSLHPSIRLVLHPSTRLSPPESGPAWVCGVLHPQIPSLLFKNKKTLKFVWMRSW